MVRSLPCEVFETAGFPTGKTLCVVGLVAALVYAVLVHLIDGLILALGPILALVSLVVQPTKRMHATLEADGIRFFNQPELIPYAVISNLSFGSKVGKKAYPVAVLVDTFAYTFPTNLNIPSQDLWDTLRAHVPVAPVIPLPQVEPYWLALLERFPPDQVWLCAGRPMIQHAGWRAPWLTYAAMCIVAGVWCGYGATRLENFVVVVTGLLTMVILAIMAVRRFQIGVSQKPKTHAVNLVLSPVGLAIVGPITGQMEWREVKNVKLTRTGTTKLSNFEVYQGPMIDISVAGAKIQIPDIYDRGIEEIEGIIKHLLSSPIVFDPTPRTTWS